MSVGAGGRAGEWTEEVLFAYQALSVVVVLVVVLVVLV